MKKENECNHETGILNKIKTEKETLEYIVCTRCATTTINKGQYEHKKGLIMKVYERDGYFKEYKIYTRK